MGVAIQLEPRVRARELGILESPSYSLLDEKAQDLVREWASEPDCTQEKNDFEVDLRSAMLNRRSLEQALIDGDVFLKKLDPATFLIQAKSERYKAKLDAIENKLEFLYYLVTMSAERAKETRNTPFFAAHEAHLQRVENMLVALRDAKREAADPSAKFSPLMNSPATAGERAKPMRYFGMLYIVPAIEKALESMTLDDASNMQQVPASFNDLRLYLVWANALAQCICNMIAESVKVTLTITQAFLDDMAFITGSLGWILYFSTFGFTASLLLQNTLDLKGTYFESWGITEKVQALNIAWHERFKAQWDERKFLILNNAVWGVVNFICFFWLVGQNVLGYWGNVLTGVLLAADLALVCWQFAEAETEHNRRLNFYKKGIETLTLKIWKLEQVEPQDKDMIAKFQYERDELCETRRNAERDWKYRMKQHELNLTYGVGVVGAFALLCAFFFPPAMVAPLTGTILALVGSAMCFGLGMGLNALSGDIILQKETEVLGLTTYDYEASLELFKQVSRDLKKFPDDLKLQEDSKLLYLSLKKSMTTEDYQRQLVDYQKSQIICDVLTDLILPTLFVLAFVFMPLGIGMPIFAVGLITLFYANWQVAEMAPEDKKPEMFKKLDMFIDAVAAWLYPKDTQEPALEMKAMAQFDEAGYNTFCKRFDKGEQASDILMEQLKLEPPPESATDEICPQIVK